MTSGTMHFLLILSFLASYITLGLSLSCETCHAFRSTCTGSMAHCPPEKDSCGIIQMEGSGLMQIKGIVKSCLQSSSCAERFPSINLGRAGQMFHQITCCSGRECQNEPPPFTRKNMTPNGKRCPACYVVHSHECEAEMAECAGDENYCFEIFGTLEIGGIPADMVMKGCTSSASCNASLDQESLGSIKVISKSTCTRASVSASSVLASSSSKDGGFLLQASVGLLLLKVLG